MPLISYTVLFVASVNSEIVDWNIVYVNWFLTAIGLTPCDSSTVHIYTQTAHTIQWTEHT
jgi:hypothetical protein